MSKPRIFLSSTCYDLKEVRNNLEQLILGMGYEPVRNENGDIPYGNNYPLEEYCYDEIKSVDILVSVLSSRYGIASSTHDGSISQIELETAASLHKQVYIFIDAAVAADYRLYQKNKGKDINYNSVQDTRVFGVLDSVYSKFSKCISIKEYQDSNEICNYLRKQLAGLFCMLLRQNERLQQQAENANNSNPQNKKESSEEPVRTIDIKKWYRTEDSTVLFSYLMAKAFPGVRGIKWFDGKEAVDRLAILFKDLDHNAQKSNEERIVADPIWFFRGHLGMHIDNFERLSDTKVLMWMDELEIKRIAVHRDSSRYYLDFIYVEVNPEEQTGVNRLTNEQIEESVRDRGYAFEEFGWFKGRAITCEERDDGAAVIDGKVVDAHGAMARTRYLSPYNFLITAKFSPFNSQKFCTDTNALFNAILKGVYKPEEFFGYLCSYEKKSD